MQLKRVLLTGDDGYNSIGTRLLIHFLKNRFDLSIAATKYQQSGVGGKLSLSGPIHWEEIEIDGVKGVSVDGTPADAMDVAQGYFDRPFDYTISGINLGANIGGSFFSSGTISAATRSLILHVSEQAIVFSIHIDPSHWFKKHDVNEDISPYLDYPGIQASRAVDMIIKNNFWNSSLINVNFPEQKTNTAIFTEPLSDLKEFYSYPGKLDRKNKTYRHPMAMSTNDIPIHKDAGAIRNGFISITPCEASFLNEKAYRSLKPKKIMLAD